MEMTLVKSTFMSFSGVYVELTRADPGERLSIAWFLCPFRVKSECFKLFREGGEVPLWGLSTSLCVVSLELVGQV